MKFVGERRALAAIVLAFFFMYFVLAARFELSAGTVATPLPLAWLLAGLALAVPLLTVAVSRLTFASASRIQPRTKKVVSSSGTSRSMLPHSG